MKGVGVAFARFLNVPFDTGVLIGIGIVFFYAVLGGMKGITYTQVAQFCVLIFAFTVPAIFISLQICGILAILSEPFLPNASKKIREIINLKETKWTTLNIDQPILNSSNKINKPELIFRKIEDEEIQNQIDKLNN